MDYHVVGEDYKEGATSSLSSIYIPTHLPSSPPATAVPMNACSHSSALGGAAQPSYMYPLKGISFLANHPSQLWGAVLLPIVVSIAIGVGAFVVLMAGGLYPQALFFLTYTPLPPWAAWILSLVLVFLETVLLSFILAQLFLDHARTRLYAKVFELNGLQFSSLDRVIQGTGNAYFQWVSQRAIFLFLFFQMVATLPINLVPVAGTICYAGLNGVSFAWALQGVYFERKGLSFLQQWKFVKTHLNDYLSFGAVAVLLDSIPVFNILFFYTNIIGSALWAIDMEKAQTLENSFLLPANALIDDVGIIDTEELN